MAAHRPHHKQPTAIGARVEPAANIIQEAPVFTAESLDSEKPAVERIVTISSIRTDRRKSYILTLDRLGAASPMLHWSILPPIKQRIQAAAAKADALGVGWLHMTMGELLSIEEVRSAYDEPMETGRAPVSADNVSMFLDGSAKRLILQTEQVSGFDGFSYTFDFPGEDPAGQWCCWRTELEPVAEQFRHLLDVAAISYEELGPMMLRSNT